MTKHGPRTALRLRRYWMVVGLLMFVFTILFVVVEALGVPLLSDPAPWLDQGGVPAAVLGVGLLIADVFLPVPSSLVMIAHGALFGVLMGTALSLVGSIGAALLGVAIGRRGGGLLDRFVTTEERALADRLLARWGLLAIVITRPVPILAETVALLAGAARLPVGPVAFAAAAGALPGALLYALAGAISTRFHNTVLMFALVLLIAALFWLIGHRIEQRLRERVDAL